MTLSALLERHHASSLQGSVPLLLEVLGVPALRGTSVWVSTFRCCHSDSGHRARPALSEQKGGQAAKVPMCAGRGVPVARGCGTAQAHMNKHTQQATNRQVQVQVHTQTDTTDTLTGTGTGTGTHTQTPQTRREVQVHTQTDTTDTDRCRYRHMHTHITDTETPQTHGQVQAKTHTQIHKPHTETPHTETPQTHGQVQAHTPPLPAATPWHAATHTNTWTHRCTDRHTDTE